MRVWLVGVQCHSVTVLEAKFFATEILDCGQHLGGWRTRRHREQHLMYEADRLLTGSCLKRRTRPELIQLEIPVLQKVIHGLHFVRAIGLQVNLPLPTDVSEML